MAFDGSGVFSRLYSWASDKASSIVVSATRMDAEMDGIATALSNCICRDGQSTITDHIPFNNKKITGLADASSGTDALNRQSADGRFTRNANDLSAETGIDVADLIPFWDTSASANKAITYANFKADLQAEGATFPAGTKLPFYQSSSPTGWTIDTTEALNDATIRIVTSGGGSTGGSAAFSTTFTSRTLTQANLPSVSLSGTAATDGAHYHFCFDNTTAGTVALSGSNYASPEHSYGASDANYQIRGAGGPPIYGRSSTEGNHTHSVSVALGGSATALNFAVKYADFRICTKD